MRQIFSFIISIVIILSMCNVTVIAQEQSGDTIILPLKIRINTDIAGPAISLYDKGILNLEGNFSIDLGARTGFFLGAGYSDYKYSQYNYEYLSHGIFIKTGVDYNFFKPDKSMGKYWAGVGLRYGLSSYTNEIPLLEHDSYWGPTVTSVPPSSYVGHYFEIAPGFRAEIFKNFTMGWSINLRALLYNGTGEDMKPVYFAGYGRGDKSMSFGLNYFLGWNISYRKIKVYLKPELPDEDEEDMETEGEQEAGETDLPILFTPTEYP